MRSPCFILVFTLLSQAQSYKVHPGVMNTDSSKSEESKSKSVNTCTKTKVTIHHDHIDHAWDLSGIRQFVRMVGWDGLIQSGVSFNVTTQLPNYPGNWTFGFKCRPLANVLEIKVNYATLETIPYHIHGHVAVGVENSSAIAFPVHVVQRNRTFRHYSFRDTFFDYTLRKRSVADDGSTTYYSSWFIFQHQLNELPGDANDEDDNFTVTLGIDVSQAQILTPSENSKECSQPNFARTEELAESPSAAVASLIL